VKTAHIIPSVKNRGQTHSFNQTSTLNCQLPVLWLAIFSDSIIYFLLAAWLSGQNVGL